MSQIYLDAKHLELSAMTLSVKIGQNDSVTRSKVC